MEASSALLKAAEELARVVVSESGSSSVAAGKEAVAELRSVLGVLDKLLLTVERSAATSETADKVRYDAMLKAVGDASARAAVFDANARKAARLQRLQWALDHCGNLKSVPFEHYVMSSNGVHLTTSSLTSFLTNMSLILYNFMKGKGTYVWDGYKRNSYHDTADKPKSNAAYHVDLVDYIHGLVGELPTIEKQSNGQFAIWLPAL